MKRRQLLKKAGLSITMGALALKAIPSFAQAAPSSLLVSEIGTNHGHDTPEITGEELMAQARNLGDGEKVTLDIQGNSNHPHSILLSKDDIAALLVGEDVELNSVGGSHSHTVILALENN